MSGARGVGIGFRRRFADDVLTTDRTLDWLEVTPENFIGRGGRFTAAFERARADFDVLAHGVSLNLGGPDPFEPDQIEGLKTFLDRYEIDSFSDHLCFSTARGFYSYDLLPLPFTEEAVTHCAARIRELSDRLERAVYIENISAYTIMPGTMDEGAFTTAVCDEADCGILLDVNNVFVNATNHGLDPEALLRSLPAHRAKQIHLAGHLDHRSGLKIDTHGAPVHDDVWPLFETALGLTGDVPVLIEWDTDVPPLETVLDEADKARAIFRKVIQDGGQRRAG